MSAHDTPEVESGETVGERATCPDCGHQYEHGGCVGPQTPSDKWAGVHPDKCDCDGICAVQPADAGEGLSEGRP